MRLPRWLSALERPLILITPKDVIPTPFSFKNELFLCHLLTSTLAIDTHLHDYIELILRLSELRAPLVHHEIVKHYYDSQQSHKDHAPTKAPRTHQGHTRSNHFRDILSIYSTNHI